MFDRIKYFIQRGKRGYSDEDTWDFCSYLCDIIPDGVRSLKNRFGCPGEMYDKKWVNNECHKWSDILEEIAQGFEAAKEIQDSTGCEYKKYVKDGAYVFEYDAERAKILTKKFERGMDLFKQYFFNLWD